MVVKNSLEAKWSKFWIQYFRKCFYVLISELNGMNNNSDISSENIEDIFDEHIKRELVDTGKTTCFNRYNHLGRCIQHRKSLGG